MHARLTAWALGVAAALASATPAPAQAAAVSCRGDVANGGEPVLLVHGTGGSGREEWVDPVDLAGALVRAGHAACWMDLPEQGLADVRDAATRVVVAIREVHRRAGRPIAVYGHSQGGLLLRLALTPRPGLRRQVADAVAVAGTLHGTTWGQQATTIGLLCTPLVGCPPALWQQTIGSHVLEALDTVRDPTPGPVAWTTIRSTTDDLVTPQVGTPVSALRGASDVVLQEVCPGRQADHVQTAFDAVSWAALRDAITHRGPARLRRLRRDVCATRFAPGLDPARVDGLARTSRAVIAARILAYPRPVRAEPAPRVSGPASR